MIERLRVRTDGTLLGTHIYTAGGGEIAARRVDVRFDYEQRTPELDVVITIPGEYVDVEWIPREKP